MVRSGKFTTEADMAEGRGVRYAFPRHPFMTRDQLTPAQRQARSLAEKQKILEERNIEIGDTVAEDGLPRSYLLTGFTKTGEAILKNHPRPQVSPRLLVLVKKGKKGVAK